MGSKSKPKRRAYSKLTQDPNYFFTAPQNRFLPSFQQQQNDYINEDISPFRQTSPGFQQIDPYYQQGDLQTSDLPLHLQQTLPQYRLSGLSLTTNQPSGFQIQSHNYQPSDSQQPAPFRSQNQFVAPSTHRPNYSHLFSKTSHNHDPSQTETFLGQITIESPAELPPEFTNRAVPGFRPSAEFPQKSRTPPPPASEWRFRKSKKNDVSRFVESPENVNQNLDYTEKPRSGNAVLLGKHTRGGGFLNHRSRIFAPESESTYKTKPFIKNYFVNTNGDVYITTKNPFSPKPTSTTPEPTTVHRKNPFRPSSKPTGKPVTYNLKPSKLPFIPKRPAVTTEKTFDLDSLLEEPIDKSEYSKHNHQDVEVIKSVTVPPDQFYTVKLESEEPVETTLAEHDFTSTIKDYTTLTNNYDTIGDNDNISTPNRDIENSGKNFDDFLNRPIIDLKENSGGEIHNKESKEHSEHNHGDVQDTKEKKLEEKNEEHGEHFEENYEDAQYTIEKKTKESSKKHYEHPEEDEASENKPKELSGETYEDVQDTIKNNAKENSEKHQEHPEEDGEEELHEASENKSKELSGETYEDVQDAKENSKKHQEHPEEDGEKDLHEASERKPKELSGETYEDVQDTIKNNAKENSKKHQEPPEEDGEKDLHEASERKPKELSGETYEDVQDTIKNNAKENSKKHQEHPEEDGEKELHEASEKKPKEPSEEIYEDGQDIIKKKANENSKKQAEHPEEDSEEEIHRTSEKNSKEHSQDINEDEDFDDAVEKKVSEHSQENDALLESVKEDSQEDDVIGKKATEPSLQRDGEKDHNESGKESPPDAEAIEQKATKHAQQENKEKIQSGNGNENSQEADAIGKNATEHSQPKNKEEEEEEEEIQSDEVKIKSMADSRENYEEETEVGESAEKSEENEEEDVHGSQNKSHSGEIKIKPMADSREETEVRNQKEATKMPEENEKQDVHRSQSKADNRQAKSAEDIEYEDYESSELEDHEDTHMHDGAHQEEPPPDYSEEEAGSYESNAVQDYQEYEDDGHEATHASLKTNNASYDILTIKPSSMVKDDNFRKFVDTAVIDATDGDSPLTTSSSEETNVNVSVLDRLRANAEHQQRQNQNATDFLDSVVSVVTTKSVVNNTVIASATPMPLVTQQMSSPTPLEENSTDTWIVIASVQTSRSVSGARYLPSHIVEQEERTKLLNEEAPKNKTGKSRTLIEPAEDNTFKPNSEESTDIEEIYTTMSSSAKPKTSTESLTDKLDRVQSDLSSRLLTDGFNNGGNNIAVITKEEEEDEVTTTSTTTTTTTTTTTSTTVKPTSLPPVVIRKFSAKDRPSSTPRSRRLFDNSRKDDLTGLLPPGFKPRYQKTTTTTAASFDINLPQGDDPGAIPEIRLKNSTTGRSSGLSFKNKIATQDVNAFLPQKEEVDHAPKKLEDLLRNIKQLDPTALLPPGYKPKNESTIKPIVKTTKQGDLSALLPPGYKPPETKPNVTFDDISKFLPSGYRPQKTTEEPKKDDLLTDVKPLDISAFLPKGYKPPSASNTTGKPKGVESILAKAQPVDVSSLLPPGYKPPNATSVENRTKGISDLFEEAKPEDISAFLPAGYKPRTTTFRPRTSKVTTEAAPVSSTPVTTTSGAFKVVFPSRPGGGARKSQRLTTAKSVEVEPTTPTAPAIHKGWPSRATTEFTGWPTPSTTPISIEKLLEAARMASSTSSTTSSTTSTTSTTTTTTTTTTPKPTTPGICVDECDLAGTIKLVGGAKWVPELLDSNTKEWQILANAVRSQLEEVYSKSPLLNKWYKKIRIDGFSEGSVLVDYLVELNDVGRQVDTLEIKKIFHESLDDALKVSNREPKSTDLSDDGDDDDDDSKIDGKLSLGSFIVDPKFTDFIVLPKQTSPTVGYADDDILLPQWAIAVIVIGLASLLFVIIFGVTVLVNRQKNAKKRQPAPLTEDMINELNKNHMGGIDNYGADDLYNMEDVWNDRPYETKPKKRSNGSIHDNSMSNLYDSWRSEWNGYYYNAYYGNNPGSSHNNGYNSRRRSDYDTNF